ncbi:alkaline phosphatase PafA [Flavivirga sp. 57AJ16]|uniref:alkaline phosphatase PafA n=1 Tax=Flavivirga sp. 57AJ16 TaxID=3025307 RepID=UPI0023652876|nr:alkaline phosphatase PafA [Flavivirga sp. 57AJ16]MDD7886268.1 alkaline phosphatase family protein [Flavivirga sp. 57AJ16]
MNLKKDIIKYFTIHVLLFLGMGINAQTAKKIQHQEKPKLVVGVILDQMRAEYLNRFKANFGDDGFKRLMKDGFNAKNTHYNYIPTATCLGHASIYTGTTPTNHGIVSNDWYNRRLKRKMYCVEDTTVFLVNNLGIDTSTVNHRFSRSPKNIKTTTITDELKLFSNGRSKVIGVSIKDRSAISPAGHLANAAYWYNNKTGDFITSSYYTKTLPNWLVAFNKSKKADSLLNSTWAPLLPINQYINSNADDDDFEKILKGRKKSTFPYNLKELRKSNGNYALLTETPFGNSLLTKMVQATLKGEKLGKGPETDFLAISYSSTDYVGHAFGIRSKELEDTYVRMDREIAQLLKVLDDQVGKGNYLLFLTADHGASDHPQFLESNHLPGEFFSVQDIKTGLNNHLSEVYGTADYVAYLDNTQLYFTDEVQIPKETLINEAVSFLKKIPGVKEVYAPSLNSWTLANSSIGELIRNSFDPNESGDIIYHMYSGWMASRNYGTTHSTAYNSDTHVPLLWYGWDIPQGISVKPYRITQVAPTIAFILDIPLPNASDKSPIEALFINN